MLIVDLLISKIIINLDRIVSRGRHLLAEVVDAPVAQLFQYTLKLPLCLFHKTDMKCVAVILISSGGCGKPA